MQSNMDINTFYHHALQWQHQQEEAARLADEEMAEAIRAQWKRIADEIRQALPVEGMIIMETERGQFTEFPHEGHLIDVDCIFDHAVKEVVQHRDGELMQGVIRVRLFWDKQAVEPEWNILKFVVWVDGKPTEFDNPYTAFLAAFPTMQNNVV